MFARFTVAGLLAATVAGCAQQAQTSPPGGGSGSTVPANAPINYQGFPYNIKAG